MDAVPAGPGCALQQPAQRPQNWPARALTAGITAPKRVREGFPASSVENRDRLVAIWNALKGRGCRPLISSSLGVRSRRRSGPTSVDRTASQPNLPRPSRRGERWRPGEIVGDHQRDQPGELAPYWRSFLPAGSRRRVAISAEGSLNARWIGWARRWFRCWSHPPLRRRSRPGFRRPIAEEPHRN